MSIFRARYLIPAAGRLVENGAVAIEGGRIVAAGPVDEVDRVASGTRYDLGPAVILPGYVNAHSHLELSALADRITTFVDFADWIRQLVVLKREMDDAAFARSILDGAAEMLQSGITTVGDIITRLPSLPAIAATPLRALVFHEVIAPKPADAERAMTALQAALDLAAGTVQRSGGRVRLGVSPHAPYSVSARLYRASLALAVERGLRVTTHLAETLEEAEFVTHRRGVLFEHMKKNGFCTDLGIEGASSPIEYAESLGLLGGPNLLVHVNYPSDGDLVRLAAGKASVAYCPGSHAYFRHAPHPVERLRAAGVTVALGTDSRASNAALDMQREMRLVRSSHPAIAPSQVLEMAALNGAKALGWGAEIGTLEEGKRADLIACMGVEGRTPDEIAESLIESAAPPFLVMVDGVAAVHPKGM